MATNPTFLRALTVAVPLALAALAGCSEPRVDKWRKDLAAAEGRWRSAGLRDYEMDVVRSCYCLDAQNRPVTVTVRGGAFASLVFMDSAGTAADTSLFQQYLTMDRIFALLHDVLDTEPAALHAEYNAAYGFPTLWAVDPDNRMVDEEFTIQVLALRPLAAGTLAGRSGAPPR